MDYLQHLNAMGITSWVPRSTVPTLLSVYTLQGQVDAQFQVILDNPPQNAKEQQLLQAILKILPEHHVAYLSHDKDAVTISYSPQKTWVLLGENELFSNELILPSLSNVIINPSFKRKIYQQLAFVIP